MQFISVHPNVKGFLVKSSDQPTSGQVDQELVLRVQRGDKTAFDQLVRKYQHKIIQLVNRYVQDPREAQDVA